MKLVRLSPALVGAVLMLSSAALAQTPAPKATGAMMPAARAPAAKAPAAKALKAPVVRTAKALDCSKQADAKNVHGKARKTFMSTCKKA